MILKEMAVWGEVAGGFPVEPGGVSVWASCFGCGGERGRWAVGLSGRARLWGIVGPRGR